MGIFKLRPAQPDAEVVSDLDRLIRTPVAFRLHGNIHEIKPVTTEQFLKLSSGFAKLDALEKRVRAGERIEERELVENYHMLFKLACDSLTKEDFMQMEHPQRAALLELVMQSVTGRAHIEAEKKNVIPTSQIH